MSNRPSIQAELMIGFEIMQAHMGMAILVPGVQQHDDDGQAVAIGRGALLLSESLCRELAAGLHQMADRLQQSSGSA